MRPVLLLDVDGPISPWAAARDRKPAGFVEHRFRLRGWSRRRPLKMWLDPGLGARLRALADRFGLDLAWATNWEHEANALMGPAIGLPTLPVVEFPAGLEPLPGREFTWKYGPVGRYAHGRPLAWLDDDFDAYPRARDEFLDRRRAAGLATELVGVDPRTGIGAEHLTKIADWAGSLQRQAE